MQIEQMPMVRLFFEKRGRAKYTSHLDTMRMFTRSLRRSGLPVWYTQGFNPHLYMTFALPIALGYESLCESLDVRFTEPVPYEEIVERVNAALPPGFRAIGANAPLYQPSRIAWADYAVALFYPERSSESLREEWSSFVSQPVIEVMKRTKKGEKLVDIKPLIQELDVESCSGGLSLQLRCAAGTQLNIAPTLVLKAFDCWLGDAPDSTRIVRRAILCDDLQPFC